METKRTKPLSPLGLVIRIHLFGTGESVRSYAAQCGIPTATMPHLLRTNPPHISLQTYFRLLSALPADVRHRAEQAVRECCTAVPAAGLQETMR